MCFYVTKELTMQRRGLLRTGLLLASAAAAGSFALASGFAGFERDAPEFTGIDGWINTNAPVSVAGLRRKVLLVNFWTYSCINCRRTIPYLKRFQSEYGPLGLQVIGIHTPEFGFEHDRANVDTYVRQTGISYPVGQDNNFRTWDAWNNDVWPGFYIVNRDGRIVQVYLGEDHAHEMEGTIRDLLGLSRTVPYGHQGDDPDLSRIGSPEMYFGSIHPTPQDSRQSPGLGEADYSFVPPPRLNEYQLNGVWSRNGEPLVLWSPQGALRLRFSGAKLHLVAGAPKATTVHIRVDGREAHALEISWPTMYTLVNGDTYGEHLLELETDTPGLALFSATFG
jgi:thiol-disulfide isomerase/thioredoxin